MLSNVTKTADVLRGNTQMQDLWLEVEKETSHWHKGLPPPKQLQNALRIGKALNEKERQDALERLATMRQQKTNFYISESASKLMQAKSDMPKAERKTVRDRLYKPTKTVANKLRPKSPTNLGHVLATGEHAPSSPERTKPKTPKSRAEVSSPTTDGSTRKKKANFQGLTMADFQTKDWTPSFEYKPAAQTHPWTNVRPPDRCRACSLLRPSRRPRPPFSAFCKCCPLPPLKDVYIS